QREEWTPEYRTARSDRWTRQQTLVPLRQRPQTAASATERRRQRQVGAASECASCFGFPPPTGSTRLRPMLARSTNYPRGREGPYPSPYHQNVQSLLDMLKRLVNGTN